MHTDGASCAPVDGSYAVIEASAAPCPVLVSRSLPWTELVAGNCWVPRSVVFPLDTRKVIETPPTPAPPQSQ